MLNSNISCNFVEPMNSHSGGVFLISNDKIAHRQTSLGSKGRNVELPIVSITFQIKI